MEVTTNLQILENILNNVITNIKKQDFLIYFRLISIMSISENKVVFWVQSKFMQWNLEAKFYNLIKEATAKELPEITEIEFEIDNTIENPSNKNKVDCSSLYKTFGKPTKKATAWEKLEAYYTQSSPDNKEASRYTMQNYIVWQSNQLAYSAAEAVIRNPGKSYNPLYIYWEVWLGKTHLLQAVWNDIYKKYKDKDVRYMTADKFINEYVSAVKKKWVEKLRQKYAEADVIIIDDVQFLSKKEQTQNELYNIFNILYDAQKQIIISWDRPPKELTELEPRLKSRFEWGIIVDIGKPDFETRLAILQEKARAKEFLIPHDVAEFIAANVTDSIRELEWVLNQLIAEYELDNSVPTLEKVAKKLKKLKFTSDMLWEVKVKQQKTSIKSYEDIIDAVSKHFGIEKEWILWDVRKKEFMIPRQVAMYLLKTKMNYTYERIWNIFSWRNHAAVLYSCNKLDTILKTDKDLLYEINVLREWIWL